MGNAMTAHQMRQALYAHFMGRYAVVFEVAARPEGSLREKLQAAATTDEIDDIRDNHKIRRIDALLVRRVPKREPTAAQRAAQWRDEFEAQRRERAAKAGEPEPEPLFQVDKPRPRPGAVDRGDDGGLERLALEIKVTRGDFFQDVRHPEKQAPWRELAERHAYAVPDGLVRLEEVPRESGLLIVSDRTGVKWARTAPRSQTARPLPVANQLDAFYRWARAEARALGLDSAGRREDGDPETMRVELARLRHEVELLEGRIDRAEERAEMWKRRYAVLDPPACLTCGKPIRPARKATTNGYLRWEHSPADEGMCVVLRTARAMEAEEAKPPNRRYGLYVPGPEPAHPDDQPAEVTAA